MGCNQTGRALLSGVQSDDILAFWVGGMQWLAKLHSKGVTSESQRY